MQSSIDSVGWIRSLVRITPGDPAMTIARAHPVDPTVTRWYHCVTRCVRRAFLLGEGMYDRKSWIEHRLEALAEIFSVAVAGFAILDNHLHLLVRLDPDVALGWSDSRRILAGQLPAPGGVHRAVVPRGQSRISGELAGVFERLGSNAENWQARLRKLAAGRLLGRFFAASRARLREVAERLGVHHLANLGGCAAR